MRPRIALVLVRAGRRGTSVIRAGPGGRAATATVIPVVALIDVGATYASPGPVRSITRAGKAPRGVRAGGVAVAVMRPRIALVDISTNWRSRNVVRAGPVGRAATASIVDGA